MSNEIETVFPIIHNSLLSVEQSGLTKREHFAALAMHGLLSNPTYFNPNEKHKMILDGTLCNRSVEFADLMLKQLSK